MSMELRTQLGRVAIVLALAALVTLFNYSIVSADDPGGEHMDMTEESDHESDGHAAEADSSEMTGDMPGAMPAMNMQGMSVGSTWQDQINKISYPITAVLAMFAVWVCVQLIRATGLTDKFAMMSAGLGLFLVQAVAGVLFYATDGAAVSMPTLMFMMSVLNSAAMVLIGFAFFRWKQMVR